ncbi:MAG: circadian clock KaiB family protein [Pseudomonadota bacterium]|nr:circadian clock KaiB family protein [Pseudomonadota bacterium]
MMTSIDHGAGLRLRLFIVAGSPGSRIALSNLERVMAEAGIDRASVEIVDVSEAPDKAVAAGVLVTPTLDVTRGDRHFQISGRLNDVPGVIGRLAG